MDGMSKKVAGAEEGARNKFDAVWPVTGYFDGGEVCGAAPSCPGTGSSESSDEVVAPPAFPSKFFDGSTTATTATPMARRVTAIMADTKPFR